VRGEKTNAVARAIVDLLHAAIPGAIVVEIPGAGQMSPISHPQAANAAIAAHLAQTARGTS
jgi:pimeloyl-ACP methyl ester carboxylesterase